VPGTAASTSLLKLGPNTQTITGGAITATNSYIQVAGNTGNYALSTINVSNGPDNGTVIVLQANNPSSSITVNHNTNIRLNGGAPHTLTGYNTLQLIYSIISSSWLELSRTSISGPQQAVLTILQTMQTTNISSSGADITISEANNYPLSNFVSSNNSSTSLIYSYDPAPTGITFDTSTNNGVTTVSMVIGTGNSQSFDIIVNQNGDNNYLAPDPVTLHVTVSTP
jgi:hypothetical protein